ncbi:Transmembrane protein 181 [Eumeta japonica]|uniref:Transmembrane protein 181 n=1 Tax=Eumeta variegata TaxID=151549 RepID=A0A4C1ZQP5_EUMVA|nr:Transmembrane protein 181 [Eumeta japonica]
MTLSDPRPQRCDGDDANERSFGSFYLFKAILVGMVWTPAMVITLWQKYYACYDPTYNYVMNTNYSVDDYHDTRLRCLSIVVGTVTALTALLAAQGWGPAALQDHWASQPRVHYDTSAPFMALYGLFNFKMYILAYLFSPGTGSIQGNKAAGRIEIAAENKTAIGLVTQGNYSEIDPILPEEWKIIECCVELLKPLKKPHVNLAVLTLISSVIPIIWMLTQKLAETPDILASRTISPSTERAKKMRMTDSMDTDSERPGTSGTGRQSCLISDLAMIPDSLSDDESQKTPEINNPDIRIRIRIRGCEPLKIRIRGCGKKWIRNIPNSDVQNKTAVFLLVRVRLSLVYSFLKYAECNVQLRYVVETTITKDNPAFSMINDSDEEVIYGSDEESRRPLNSHNRINNEEI